MASVCPSRISTIVRASRWLMPGTFVPATEVPVAKSRTLKLGATSRRITSFGRMCGRNWRIAPNSWNRIVMTVPPPEVVWGTG